MLSSCSDSPDRADCFGLIETLIKLQHTDRRREPAAVIMQRNLA